MRSPFTPSPFLTAPSAAMSLGQINPGPADTVQPEPAPSKKRACRDDVQPAKRYKPAAKAEWRGFKCDYPDCNQVSDRKFNLDVHKRTHTGERPFSCGECMKRFSRNNDLKRHIATHSGKRPHPCPVCPRSFVRHDKLQKHMAKCMQLA